MIRPFRAFIRFYGLPLLLAIACSSVAWACPNCKDTLANDPAQAGLVRGFFWSIMFMVSMPFLVLGGVSAYFYWEVCRARRAKQALLAQEFHTLTCDSPFAESNSHVEEREPVGVG